MEQEQIIKIIRDRIYDEHRKNPDLDWQTIAANKIYTSLLDEDIFYKIKRINIPSDAVMMDEFHNWSKTLNKNHLTGFGEYYLRFGGAKKSSKAYKLESPAFLRSRWRIIFSGGL